MYSGHQFQFDKCENVISYEVGNQTNFNKKSLLELSKSCFDAYKFRLEDISKEIKSLGKTEYDIINAELISLILPFNPLKFSFSISSDPSLHFFVRFNGNVSLFIEVFLDQEEGNDTYIQISKAHHTTYEKNLKFDDVVEEIRKQIEHELSDKSKTFRNLSKVLAGCQTYRKDLFLMKQK